VSVKVNAVVYFRVMNAIKAIVEVETFLYATSQLESRTRKAGQDHSCRRRISSGPKAGDAASVVAKEPVALQLRYLQTLTEIGVERNTTLIFPLAIDIFGACGRRNGDIVNKKEGHP